MIKLFQFNRVWGLPNGSPFCTKLETYLRMAQLPFEVEFISRPQGAPKGKLPFIEMDGKRYPDSEFIIDELKRYHGDALDQHLTKEQRALAVLIDEACCERLYWVSVYFAWQDDTGWAVVKEGYFGRLPALLRWFLPEQIRKHMIKTLYAEGIGRHSRQENAYLGCKTIDALATMLGDKPYFLGDKPTSIDATTFAFMVNTLLRPGDNPLKKHALTIDTLKTYCDRMWGEYYSDLPRPDTHW